jgi:putative phosphoribosyl transferase
VVSAVSDRGVAVGLHTLELSGRLAMPDGAKGIVLVVSDPKDATRRASDRRLAHRLTAAGLGMLSVDLLAPDERARANDGSAPDPDLLAVRVLAVTRWLRAHPSTRDRSVAYFGAGAGVRVALLAAAEDPTVAALVACGGRPDLLAAQLSAVRAPTLLVADRADAVSVAGHRDALRHLCCERALVVVPRATDPIDDVGASEGAADVSVEWFERHLVGHVRAASPDQEELQ